LAKPVRKYWQQLSAMTADAKVNVLRDSHKSDSAYSTDADPETTTNLTRLGKVDKKRPHAGFSLDFLLIVVSKGA
jgi:hypothetical protein